MRRLLAASALLLLGCPPAEEEFRQPTLEAPASHEGFQVSTETVAAPNSEVWKCAVYPIPVDDWAAVNWVEYQQTEGMHHATLLTPGIGIEGPPPGLYDCEDLYGDDMGDNISFFGAQGDAEGTMHLPEGVAANFPPTLTIIHEMHYVNTRDVEVPVFSVINAYTIRQDDVVEGIWGGQVRDENIEIPVDAEAHNEWSRCVMNRDVEVLFLASHSHKLGTEFTIRRFDGTDSGEVFYSNDDWHTPKIVQYEQPLVIPEGEGFEWACTWRNTTGEHVSYGPTADDEMCNLAIVFMPFDMSAACEVVETSDGVLWEG